MGIVIFPERIPEEHSGGYGVAMEILWEKLRRN